MKKTSQNAWSFLKMVFTHKRMKALYWSIAGMALPIIGGVVLEVLPQFGVKETVIVFVGLIIAQITKAINTSSK
jgi:hypothetical protein